MQLTSEQKEFISTHEREDLRETALRFVRDDMPLLLTQIAGRQMAEKKIPAWYAQTDIIYPVHLSLEQSSSEATARYKASLVAERSGVSASAAATNRRSVAAKKERSAGFSSVAVPADHTSIEVNNGTFADLTGGMGVDFSFLSPLFRQSVYVERNEALCRIAAHNFGVLGLQHTTVHCADAETFLKQTEPLDFIYLDPSRRDPAGRKMFRIEDCSPDLSEIKERLFAKADRVMVKYSPMLDISQAIKSLGCVAEVHVVSVDNECKELLFLLSKEATDLSKTDVTNPTFIAVNLKKKGGREQFAFTTVQEQNATIPFADEPGRYLYEPNASMLKAGAFKSAAQAYNLSKLHVNSHLYTSDELIPDFPGRVFEVDTFFLPNKRNLKSFLQATQKANITVRNFPMTVAEIRRKTGLAEGGDIYLFATTLAGGQKVWIICRKVYTD